MPTMPEITAIGNPNLSNWTASLNFLPKIKKKPITKNPNRLIKRESEKIFRLRRREIFNYLNLILFKSNLIDKFYQIKKASLFEAF